MKNPYEKVRYSNFGSKEEAIHKLIKDIEKFKVHLPEDFSEEQLFEGYGNAVCFIVNDLTNRELIRRKFTFKQPSIHMYQQPISYYDDADEDTDVFQGSTVFGEGSDVQNQFDLKLNEKALKKSKDVTSSL